MTKCSKWLPGHDQAAAARAAVPEPTNSRPISRRWRTGSPRSASVVGDSGRLLQRERMGINSPDDREPLRKPEISRFMFAMGTRKGDAV